MPFPGMKVIIISGAPATGKTTLAEIIRKKLHFHRIDINKIVKEHELCEEHDEARGCNVIDTKKLNKIIIEIIKNSKKNVVIDSHFIHHLQKKYVDLCIITHCDLKILKQRLEKRRYSKAKVRENLDAEIFDTCLIEAQEHGHSVMVVDTSKKTKEREMINAIKEKL